MTELLSIGFSGFCINTGKHILPLDYANIFKKLKENLGDGDFPDDFIAYLEFTFSFGERDVLLCGTEDYSFGTAYYEKLKNNGGISDGDLDKFKIWAIHYPSNFQICGPDDGRYEPLNKKRYIFSVDSHIEQTFDATADG